MRLNPKRRAQLEGFGQSSFLDDLEATLDAMLDAAGCPKEVQWTDEDIRKLKQAMLLDVLKTLRQQRLTANTRSELLSWIAQPLKNGGYATPFSFEDCSIAADFNPIVLREHMLRIFK